MRILAWTGGTILHAMLLCLPDEHLNISGMKNEMSIKEDLKREPGKSKSIVDFPSKNENEEKIDIINEIMVKYPEMVLEENKINAKIQVVLDIAMYRQKKSNGNILGLVKYLYKKFEKNNKQKHMLLQYAVKCQLWDDAIVIVNKEKKKMSASLGIRFNLLSSISLVLGEMRIYL